jgi:flagellar hook-associated protein 1 FlgK
MGSLSAALLNAANSLSVYDQALQVTENNVTNANTPDYAAQTEAFVAEPFDPTVGLPGGVTAGPLQSSRSPYAEQSVRQQQTALGYSQQKTTDLSSLETFFDPSSTTGVAGSLNSFFSSLSALSVSPNDSDARQAVLTQAAQLASSFQQSATGLLTASSNIDAETRGTIASVNQLIGTIAQINSQGRIDLNGSVDAGVDATLNSTLENLSQLVSFTVLQQPGGQVNVYLDGQTPLVLGDQSYGIQGDFSTPQTQILDSNGKNITAQVTDGQLGAMLDTKNNSIPSYLSGLNTLAQSVADQVNNTLSAGVDESGAAPASDLFSYNASNGAALTLSVNPLTTDQLAAALPGAPGGNGNALNLAALANGANTNGYTFAQFLGNVGGSLGSDISNAQDAQSTDQNLLTQAQNLRSGISGVSLDEEATQLVTYQRGYEAIAKMVTVLDDLTETVIQMITPTS